MKTLKKGTLDCPKDKTPMFFEMVPGMRVKREIDGKMVYSAECPKCKKFYYVEATPC